MSVQRHSINTALQPLDFSMNYKFVDPFSPFIKSLAEERDNGYRETKATVEGLTKDISETAIQDHAGAQKLILDSTKELGNVIKKYGVNSAEYHAAKAKVAMDINSWNKASSGWAKTYDSAVKQINEQDYLMKDAALAALIAENKKPDPRQRDSTFGTRLNSDPTLVNNESWIQGELAKNTASTKTSYNTKDEDGNLVTKEISHPSFVKINNDGTHESWVDVDDSEKIRLSNLSRSDNYIKAHTKSPEWLQAMGSSYDAEKDKTHAFNVMVNLLARSGSMFKPSGERVIATHMKPNPPKEYSQTASGQKDEKRTDSIQNLADEIKAGKIDNVAAKLMLKDKDIKSVVFNSEGNIEIKRKRGKPQVITVDKDNPFNTASSIYDSTGEAIVAPSKGKPSTEKNKYSF